MKSLLVLLTALAVASPILAHRPGAELRGATPCCLESIFRHGDVECGPCGPTRGTVLYSEGSHPRIKARASGMLWKGKDFHCDGTFTNRWAAGIKAGGTGVCIGPSSLDGQPCFVMQYSPDAKAFPNVRDELRRIGPDEWLGRSYDPTTGQPKTWFVLKSR